MKYARGFTILLALILALSTAAFASDTTFTDVPEDAYYADAVVWAMEKAVTNGTGNGAFSPNSTVTRAQAATFLWRMAGEPEPAKAETFADVEADANNRWYRTAVQWAVETGVTNGYPDGLFHPTDLCSRGMILTMLYRMQDRPWDAAMTAVPENAEDYTLEDLGNAMVQAIVNGVRTENTLPDVAEGQYYEIPVIWAMFGGILGENQVDMESRNVQPAAPCPRGEMVYFLYRASGDAPAPAAEPNVAVGTIDETVALEKDGAKITVTGIETDDFGDPRLTIRMENASGKTLRADVGDFYVNTYVFSPQVYIPVVDEDGWTFYADAVVEPGETKDAYVSLSAAEDMGIAAICELEFKAVLVVVEKDEDDYYAYADDFAEGETLSIKTSLYDAEASYDMEGTPAFEKDGLKVLVVKAENDEYSGPRISIYAFNGGSETVYFSLAALKLDGEAYEPSYSVELPAGKRGVGEVFFMIDYENIPVVKEAELTFQLMDTETWEPIETLAPVTIPFDS